MSRYNCIAFLIILGMEIDRILQTPSLTLLSSVAHLRLLCL